MKHALRLLAPAVGLALLFGATATAEQHRATRLGNPATRFAPPLATPEDLRARFRDPKLRPDIAAVLKQWGWPGKLEDLVAAAETAEISEGGISVGAVMPFMSSRENGRPICLRNVTWAGKEPAPAYLFYFSSDGQRYACITPKPCSNFLVVALGPQPKSELSLDCEAPAQVPAGRPATVCLTVGNTGNAPEPRTTVCLGIPADATVSSVSEGGVATAGGVTWAVTDLAPGATGQVCATVSAPKPGVLSFASTARGSQARAVQCACSTKVLGIPAVLLEVVDLADPIEVGQNVTYEIRITNQGSATDTNIRVVCTLPESQEFVSGTGATPVTAQDLTVTMEPLAELAPKAVAVWQVVVKATHADDARFRVELRSDQFKRPVNEDESTQQY